MCEEHGGTFPSAHARDWRDALGEQCAAWRSVRAVEYEGQGPGRAAVVMGWGAMLEQR